MSGRRRRAAGESAPRAARAARAEWQFAVLWGAAALLVRALYLAQMHAGPFATHPLIDADTYDQWAQEIARGAWLGREAFWQPPLYPYLLGVVYRIAGHSYSAVYGLQALLSAGSVALTFLIGCRTVGRAAAHGGAALFAVYGTALVFDGLLLSASLIVFLECAFLWATLRALDHPEAVRRWCAAGVLLGLSILARPEIGLAGVAIAAWIALRRGRAWVPGVRRRALGVMLGLAALCTLTATWHNYRAERDWVLVSYNAGVNFWIGNNAHAGDTIAARPFFEWRRVARLPAAQGITRASAQSAWYFRQALGWIAAHPGDAALQWLRRGALALRGREVMRNEDLYAARAYSGVLAALLWVRGVAIPFGVIGPLAVLGLWVAKRRDGPVLWMTAAVSLLTCVVFFVSARYRLPAIPVVVLWAGQALAWARERQRAGDTLSFARAGGAWIALVTLCNAGQGPATTPAMAAETQLSLATIASRDGDFPRTLEHCRAARAFKPDYPEADYEQANAFLALGQPDSAAAYAARAARTAPDIEDTWQLLAAVERQRARYPDAAAAARQALAVNPTLPDARATLAVALAQTGDAAGARAQADTLADLPGVPPEALAMAARVYFAVGEGARALDLLDRALAAGGPPDLATLRDAMRTQLESAEAQPR